MRKSNMRILIRNHFSDEIKSDSNYFKLFPDSAKNSWLPWFFQVRWNIMTFSGFPNFQVEWLPSRRLFTCVNNPIANYAKVWQVLPNCAENPECYFIPCRVLAEKRQKKMPISNARDFEWNIQTVVLKVLRSLNSNLTPEIWKFLIQNI